MSMSKIKEQKAPGLDLSYLFPAIMLAIVGLFLGGGIAFSLGVSDTLPMAIFSCSFSFSLLFIYLTICYRSEAKSIYARLEQAAELLELMPEEIVDEEFESRLIEISIATDKWINKLKGRANSEEVDRAQMAQDQAVIECDNFQNTLKLFFEKYNPTPPTSI